MTVVADITCPKCGKVRSWPLYTIRQQMKRANFNGNCRSCNSALARAGLVRAYKKRYAHGARHLNKGYALLGISSINDSDLPIFKAMLNTGGSVLEHRFVMAKHLGRPLRSDEYVDHMDGNKTNNDPVNLRIYIKGKNQPGSCRGSGTYYHELQTTEARNRLLLIELERLRARLHEG